MDSLECELLKQHELLKSNKNKFELLKQLDQHELELFVPYENISLMYLQDLLNLNITQKNIYEILWVSDCYQYINMKELTELIQELILNKQIFIDKTILNKSNLYDLICINSCLCTGNITCDLEQKIHNVPCVKYLSRTTKKELDYYMINWAALNSHIDTIKYLHDCGYKGDEITMLYGVKSKNLQIVIYLYELGYIPNEYAIDHVVRTGNIDILTYFHKHGYKANAQATSHAAIYGHIDMIKYLHECEYESNDWTIYSAASYGKIEVIKYLHKCGYEGKDMCDIICEAARTGHINTIKYLYEYGYKFNDYAIECAKTQEIRDLLTSYKYTKKLINKK